MRSPSVFPSVNRAEDLVAVVRELGFVPFFLSSVPGFSIQEMTPSEHWFSSSDELGPWDWKIDAVQSGEVVYGKFLSGGKAAFATPEWYAHLMNWRRSLPQCSPDLYGRRVLELVAEQGTVTSKDIRGLLGLKKSAADGVSSRLMYQTRLIIGDIERVYRGPELKYSGWQHCVFCTPEALFGPAQFPAADDQLAFGGFVPEAADNRLDTACTPEESRRRLLAHLSGLLPGASESSIERLVK